MEWDFSLPAVAPVVLTPDALTCAFGSAPDSWTVACGNRAVYQAEGAGWCMDHGPLSTSFRPAGSIGEAMVFCIGCGDPMTLDAALAHGCDLPPAGRL